LLVLGTSYNGAPYHYILSRIYQNGAYLSININQSAGRTLDTPARILDTP